MSISHLVIATTVATLCLAGCGNKGNEQAAKGTFTQTAPSATVAHSQTMCPVLARKINKDIHADYQGKRIYFCCENCVSTFNASPEKYVKKLVDQGVTLEATPTQPLSKGEGSSTN